MCVPPSPFHRAIAQHRSGSVRKRGVFETALLGLHLDNDRSEDNRVKIIVRVELINHWGDAQYCGRGPD
jgi:hypothetical protein